MSANRLPDRSCHHHYPGDDLVTAPKPWGGRATLTDVAADKLLAAIDALPQSPPSVPAGPPSVQARAVAPNVTARACPDPAGEPGDAQVSPPDASARAVTPTPRGVAAQGLAEAYRGRALRESRQGRPEYATATFEVAADYCAGIVAELAHMRSYVELIHLWADGYALLADRARRARSKPLPKTGETQ